MPVLNNASKLEDIINRKLIAGVRAAVETIEDQYRDSVTQVQESGPPFLGPHSKPGEFPHRETGKGEQNISNAVRGTIGKAGLLEDGLHLQYLTGIDRLGIVDSFYRSLRKIRSNAKSAMRRS